MLSGAVDGAPFDGTYGATLTAEDGSLPAPGECDAATVDLTGPRNRFLSLVATGELCGTWPDATYLVTYAFVGRCVVTGASVRQVGGTDGWIFLILATEARANVEAIDT